MSSGLGVSAIQHRNNNRKKKHSRTRNENVSTIKNDEPPLPLPSDDVEALLSLGLYLVGFGETRQGSSIIRMRRFRAFFGVGPKAIKSIHDDLNRKGHKVTSDKLFMAMNWLFTYDTELVLSGRWKLNEKTIRESVRKVVQQVPMGG
ncbi:hypothetical protein IV203_026365 [Nitzschia inconspicua]|uniref:Uncharacterized protein n=1 Tax=Nitzschia inconspicua TaxID=303405 RepID=A0A9K3LIG7_9STRA|nr:hypothetical protein IV203_026365 [Nitzschia inconspicua]